MTTPSRRCQEHGEPLPGHQAFDGDFDDIGGHGGKCGRPGGKCKLRSGGRRLVREPAPPASETVERDAPGLGRLSTAGRSSTDTFPAPVRRRSGGRCASSPKVRRPKTGTRSGSPVSLHGLHESVHIGLEGRARRRSRPALEGLRNGQTRVDTRMLRHASTSPREIRANPSAMGCAAYRARREHRSAGIVIEPSRARTTCFAAPHLQDR